jgi:hypothetical protein
MNIIAQLAYASRFEQWVEASIGFADLHTVATVYMQGLGRLDIELLWTDANRQRRNGNSDLLSALETDLTLPIMLSQLWVLGAYELVRALDEKRRSNVLSLSLDLEHKLIALKRQFERLRIPLAKLEPADRWKKTDFDVAMPALHETSGISWAVAPGVFIPRRELADELLSFGCMAREFGMMRAQKRDQTDGPVSGGSAA